jgi:hypothetical protein
MPMPNNDGSQLQALLEVASAVLAALAAAYVRARGCPNPWGWRAMAARGAEAVVCGFLAIGVAGAMEWTDSRSTIGLSAGFGLIGTEYLRDLLMRAAQKRADNG